MRRNRRFLKRADVPGNVLDEYGKLAVLVDTSGSVSDRNLQEFFAEIDKIAQLLKKVWLIQYDAEVTDVRKYKRGAWKKLEIKGRGGTDMKPAIDKAIEKKCKRAIVLTDGYDEFPDDKIDDIKLMFALTENRYEQFEEEARSKVGKNNVFVLEDRQ
jgi:predicted metal-dependent peptidase